MFKQEEDSPGPSTSSVIPKRKSDRKPLRGGGKCQTLKHSEQWLAGFTWNRILFSRFIVYKLRLILKCRLWRLNKRNRCKTAVSGWKWPTCWTLSLPQGLQQGCGCMSCFQEASDLLGLTKVSSWSAMKKEVTRGSQEIIGTVALVF